MEVSIESLNERLTAVEEKLEVGETYEEKLDKLAMSDKVTRKEYSLITGYDYGHSYQQERDGKVKSAKFGSKTFIIDYPFKGNPEELRRLREESKQRKQKKGIR